MRADGNPHITDAGCLWPLNRHGAHGTQRLHGIPESGEIVMAKPGNKNAVKNKAGRPTKYKGEETCRIAFNFALLGATDPQLAAALDVDVDTIKEWAKVHPEFSAARRKGKEEADAKVAASLYERACGYSHPEVHVSNYQGEVTLTPLTKHYPPDTAAAFIWLKNRAGWKDKVEHVHSLQQLSDDEIEAELAKLRGSAQQNAKGSRP